MISIPRPSRKISELSEPPDFPLPSELGLPDKFRSWRPGQIDALSYIVHNPKRFVFLCAPTGSGKSVMYTAASVMSGWRTMVLTSTKGLQDQLSNDLAALILDIRGLGNYRCPIAKDLGIPETTTVDDAPCQCGMKCRLKFKGPGCEYYDRYRAAQRSKLVVTNYQCWLYDSQKQSPLGDLQYGFIPDGMDIEEEMERRDKQKVKLLVIDEAHESYSELSRFVGVEVSRGECLSLRMEWPDAGMTIEQWNEWATMWNRDIQKRIADEDAKIKSGHAGWSKLYKKLKDMQRKLERLAAMQVGDEWVKNEEDVEGRSMRAVRFDPLVPARYAERYLFRGVDKVVLVSATVRPKTAELLGISEDDMDFQEYDSVFKPERRPVIFVPTVQMNYRTEQDDAEMMKWLTRIDTIIDGRLDRKGIIHAVSYNRMKFLLLNSRHKLIMLGHTKETRAEIVERFKQSEPPCILVSPSVDTGYDFAGSLARFQIIAKIPFASVQDKVVKARQDRDPEYGLYLAAQTIVQMSGRIVRSETDFGETFLIDDQAKWFLPKVRKFIPRWWWESYRIERMVPEAIGFSEEIVDEIPSMPVLGATDEAEECAEETERV